MSMSNLYLQDSLEIELGDVTLYQEKGLFMLDSKSLYPYEKKDSVWVSVTLERNLDLMELQRNTYTFFDFVSDLGGLYGFLFPFFAIVVNLWNYGAFDNMMASKLFYFTRNKYFPAEESEKVSNLPDERE